MLDSGSSTNFMTEEFVNSVGIKQRRCAVPIVALDNLPSIAKHYITVSLASTNGV